MIQFTCPHCRVRLKGKPELEGHVRKCPKCGKPVRIVADPTPVAPTDEFASEGSIPIDDVVPGQQIILPGEGHLPVFHRPEKLNRESHYFICDKTQVVASWQHNGAGWMIKSASGFVPAKRNRDGLPNQGEFQLVELKFTVTPEGKRLSGIGSHQLASHWALTVLDQGDDEICEKIVGAGNLNRDQRAAVRLALREHFMRPIWEQSTEVLNYLGDANYHTPSVG